MSFFNNQMNYSWSYPTFDGLGWLCEQHRHARCLDNVGDALCLAISTLQRPVVELETRLLEGWLQNDGCDESWPMSQDCAEIHGCSVTALLFSSNFRRHPLVVCSRFDSTERLFSLSRYKIKLFFYNLIEKLIVQYFF